MNDSAPPGTWLAENRPSTRLRTPFLLMVFLVPLIAIGFLTFRSARVERDLIEDSLFRQADALARSLEAGMRTGMMHQFLEEGSIQNLLAETTSESGAVFLGLVGPGGEIVAASGTVDPSQFPVGTLTLEPHPDQPPSGNFAGKEFFVYRKAMILPGPGSGGAGHMRMMARRRTAGLLPEGTWILVLLDAEGPLAFRARHERVTILLGLLLAAAASGFLGWIFWSQRAREVTAALARTESMARELVRQMPAGLILCGTNGMASTVNPTAGDIIGIPEKSLLHRNVTSIFAHDILPFEAVLEGGASTIREGILSRPDGSNIEISLSATPLPGRDGEVSAALLLFQDVGELKSLRERVHQAERLAELGQLASTVAHEIRNPLSSIRGFAQFLESKVSGDHSKYTRVLVEEVDRLNRVVGGLLSYARTESPDFRQWMVADILKHVQALSESDIRSKDVTLRIEPVADGLEWPLDRDMIIQALLNLVINALEASAPGQVVRLEAEPDRDRLIFRVWDQGPGTSEEESEQIFTLFYTTKDKGTGLGLPLVKKAADLHGGTAKIQRAGPEGGTVAILEIPSSRQGAPGAR